LPYHLMIILVLTAKFTGVLGPVPQGEKQVMEKPLLHPSARRDNHYAWQQK
jgi:hypothetical protein